LEGYGERRRERAADHQSSAGQLFTVLIWGENRAKFGTPEETYRNKDICVTGRIQSYRGEPEIIASVPAQLSADSR